MAYIGVVKDHAKGTLHYHILLYGGLSPYLLQRFASLGQICNAISKALDEMYRSSLPEKSLYNSVMKRIMKRPYNGYGLTLKDLVQLNLDPILERSDAINGIRNNEDFDVNWIMEKTIQQADVQEWHEHMKTCHNGFLGRDGCRMCYPAGEANVTGPVLLVPKDSDDSNDGGRYDGEADMYDNLLESDEHVLEQYFGIPICDSDEGSYGGNEDDGNYGVSYGEIRMEEEEMEYESKFKDFGWMIVPISEILIDPGKYMPLRDSQGG